MKSTLAIGLLAGIAITSACILPTTPLSNTNAGPFRIQLQNSSYPQVHNQFMNLLAAGGGDQHLFVGPVGVPTFDLSLTEGALQHIDIRAVIGGEFSDVDDTTKMFMTERGDPRALFQPTWACNPETDAVQIELPFVTWQNHPAGGWICVRPTFDNAHEFRYYPPGNTKSDPSRFCIKVTLVLVPSGGSGTTSTTSTISSSTASSTGSQRNTVQSTETIGSSSISSSLSSLNPPTSTATSTSSTVSSTPLPFSDMTAKGFAFVGCAPEDRTANDGGAFRTLSGALLGDDALTNERCIDFCVNRGFSYSGTEYARECWCGNSIAATRQPKGTIASLAGCSQACAGNINQKCGGPSWLSIYKACPSGGPCINAVFS